MRQILILIIVCILLGDSFAQSNNNFSYPGGIILKEITYEQHKKGFYYKGSKVATFKGDEGYFLLFGIPFGVVEGQNTLNLLNGDRDYYLDLLVQKKIYPSQYIKVEKKYVQPNEKELKRIIPEKRLLDRMKKKWVSTNIDTNFIIPVIGTITGTFGTQRYYNGKKGNFHNGVDIAANTGTDIVAPSPGIVILTGDFFYNGKFVYIDHGMNFKSIFIHMDRIEVKPGDKLNKGDVLGQIGNTGKSTGPHLHWSLTLNSEYVDPMIFVNNSVID